MLRLTRTVKSTRLGTKRRAETDESSLARSKYATGPLFVWSSPSQQNDHWLVNENKPKYEGLESRYVEGKVGHQENPIKDWLMPKPTRWQVEWSKYMARKAEIERVAGYSVKSKRCEQVNWDWAQECSCLLSRLGLPADIINSDELRQILSEGAPKRGTYFEQIQTNGSEFLCWYLEMFIQEVLPKVPEEGRDAIFSTLTNSKYLNYQLQHTGILDFIEIDMYSELDIITGLVGKLLDSGDSGQAFAVKVLQTVVLSGAVQRDAMRDLWRISPPRAIELIREIRPGLHTRLICQSSSTDIIRSFEVGLFDSDKNFLGSSFGETISEAECDAAIVALAEIYEIGEKSMHQYFI